MNIIILIVLLLLLFLVYKIWSKFKIPKVGALAVVNGGVKCGKSTLGLSIAFSNYKKVLRKWKFKKFLCKLFCIKFTAEKPLLYSNIPLGVDYVEIDDDLINRKKRFRFGSVIYFDEANLLADSLSALQDKSLNERVAIFNALIGHETHGGLLVYTAHNIERLHFGIRDVCCQYFYIHRCVKWIPFFILGFVRERVIGDSVVNSENEDLETTLKKVIIPKSVWKKFDCYAYSVLTDNLPVADNVINGKTLPDLKVRRFLSFKNWTDKDLNMFFKKRGDLNEKKNN